MIAVRWLYVHYLSTVMRWYLAVTCKFIELDVESGGMVEDECGHPSDKVTGALYVNIACCEVFHCAISRFARVNM